MIKFTLLCFTATCKQKKIFFLIHCIFFHKYNINSDSNSFQALMYNFQILVTILNDYLMQIIVHNLEKIILHKKMFCILTYRVFC